MRILQVISTFYPALAFGGPVKVVYEISKELANRGHEIEVYATNAYDQTRNFKPKYKEQTMNGFKITYFNNLIRPGKFFFSPEMIVALRKKLKEFDVVHTHFGRQTYDIAVDYYAKKYSVPYVLQARGSLPRIMAKQRLKWIYDSLFGYRLLRSASKVIALTRTEVQQCKDMGVPEEKIVIIPNGIDLSEYVNVPPKGSFKRKFDISEGKKIILYLGRIHEIKGIDILVKAYAYALKELRLNDTLLAIAGPDDGYLGRLKQLLSSLKMTNDVLLTGPLYGKDKLEAFIDADIFVLPSRYETFPNVVLEAYACSKPVIASNVESIPDIVLHGKTGLLFRAGDVEELAEMISYMLTHSEEAKRMGHRARKVVEEKFSIDKVVDSIEVLYEKTLEK